MILTQLWVIKELTLPLNVCSLVADRVRVKSLATMQILRLLFQRQVVAHAFQRVSP